MHSKLNRLIALCAILICLPLQGMAAVTMPSCHVHGQNTEMHVDADHSEAMPHCSHHHDGDHSNKNTPCDKCFSCYLSATLAMIPFNIAVELNGVSPMVAGPTLEILDSIPSPLFHPPRSTFA
jgi:hypothetical protein